MNLFLTRGGVVLYLGGNYAITETGLRTSVFMAVRLVLLVAGSSLMTFTTTPNGLTDGLETLPYPVPRLCIGARNISVDVYYTVSNSNLVGKTEIWKPKIAKRTEFKNEK